ncbi:MAG: GNAT family N-acetyltransferase [Pedosphaera sp.]|nr:GNAT family N-acetyltransferase [Pedosphaera sp.]
MDERPYEPSDLEQIIAVYGASIHSLAAPFYTAEQLAAWAPQNPDVNRWQQRLASLHTIIMEHDGIIAGFASYQLDGYLDFLFTHPAFARKGVATRLCRRVEAGLSAATVSRVFTKASLVARLFFERRGFLVDFEELVECGGVQLRRYEMHKQSQKSE